MVPMECSPNGKDIIAPMEYILKFNSHNRNGTDFMKDSFSKW